MLLSDTTRAIVSGDLPEGVTIRSLGDQRLKDIDQPEPLHELNIADVPTSPELPRDRPTPTSASVIPEEALANMPSWVRSAAERVSPVAGKASQLIEERVMAEIQASFAEKADRKAKKAAELPSAESPPRGSVADEIAKLRVLRDEGALTEEQYAKALDRTIAGED